MVGGDWGNVRGLGEESGGLRLVAFLAACRVSCGLWAARNACGGGALGRGGHAALCNMPRFLRPSGRSQRLRGGALGREGHAALCGLPRFLRPLGRSQRLRGWGALGRGRHAAVCGLPRFLRPLGRSQRLRRAGWGAGAWGACRALRPAAFLAAFGPLATLAPIVLRHRDLGRCPKPRQARREACAQWALGPKAQSDPKRGSETMSATVREARMIEQPGRPLHPTLSPLHPYLTTRFLSLRISSVTPSGGSPNVALSVLLPPSHVSCIAISRASIRQPSSTTVTTSPTS